MTDTRTQEAPKTPGGVRLTRITSPEPWEALLLPVSAFPVPELELDSVRIFLDRLSVEAAIQWKLSAELFLQFWQLPVANGSAKLSNYAREWLPKLGLGVWPDRPAPTLWTHEEFLDLGMGDSPRRCMHQVLRITAAPPARQRARNVMLGIGSVLEIMVDGNAAQLMAKARSVLLPPIKEPAFASFAFYVPLMDRSSIEHAKAEQLEEWSCGAALYVRESAEDNAVLIVSKQSLNFIFEALRGRRVGDAEWQFSD